MDREATNIRLLFNLCDDQKSARSIGCFIRFFFIVIFSFLARVLSFFRYYVFSFFFTR